MDLSFLELKTFLCCISLKTGSKVVGYISLVGYLILTFVTFLDMVGFARQRELDPHLAPECEIIYDYITLIAFIVQAASSLILLLGVYQEKTMLITWWLVSTIIIAVLDVFCIPSTFWLNEISATTYKEGVIISCLMLVDDIYGWLVVFSFYRTLTPNPGHSV